MITLLIDYQFHEHILWSFSALIVCLFASYGFITIWGCCWNRKWHKNRVSLSIVFICGFLAYIGILIWQSCESLHNFVVDMRENPEKIHALSDKVLSKPGYFENSYRGTLTVLDKEQAQQERDKTEEADERRILILTKKLDHAKLLIPASRYFTYDTPVIIDWNEIPTSTRSYIKEMISTNYVSVKALDNFNGNKPHIQKRNLEEWGAKAMRYLLIRQNIELISMDNKGIFKRYLTYSKIYVAIFLSICLIVIPCKACADIKARS